MPEAPPRTAVPPLFTRLFDDAAIFPPGNAAMPEAVRGHAVHRAAWYAGAVGLFVCSDDRLPELVDALPAAASPRLEVSVTVPGGIAALQHGAGTAAWSGRLRPRAVEVPLGPFRPDQARRCLGSLAEDLALTTFVEVPARELDAGLAKELVTAGLSLKLRTGGTTADSFPTDVTLAGALVTAAAAGLPFKCTAGLHNAVRHRDPATGFEHHGFLNVLAATDVAVRTGDHEAVSAVLAEQDPMTVTARIRELSADRITAVRERFRSFGTCSITDPVEDLRALGLLEAPA